MSASDVIRVVGGSCASPSSRVTAMLPGPTYTATAVACSTARTRPKPVSAIAANANPAALGAERRQLGDVGTGERRGVTARQAGDGRYRTIEVEPLDRPSYAELAEQPRIGVVGALLRSRHA